MANNASLTMQALAIRDAPSFRLKCTWHDTPPRSTKIKPPAPSPCE